MDPLQIPFWTLVLWLLDPVSRNSPKRFASHSSPQISAYLAGALVVAKL